MRTSSPPVSAPRLLNTAVVVAALGYFVDIYDLVLFSIVRIASLKDLGITNSVALLEEGVRLINMQMIGMLVGGIFWGVLGDKKGRISVLFGSIFLYSAANIANGFVSTLEAYAWLRFIAGVGLAGELGAGITLVSEVLPKEKRGYGTTIVASVGISGAILAGVIGEYFHWRTAYFVGGGLGLLLLLLRIGVYESGMYARTQAQNVVRGNFLSLFTNGARFFKYLKCILIGVPIWFVIGVLITFSPEISQALGIAVPISAAKGIAFSYFGLTLGDLASGLLSQKLRSRKSVVVLFLFLLAGIVALFLLAQGASETYFYALCVALGFGGGYWAVFVTIAAEQFGTNIRATVTTTVPNFVRGAVVILTLSFKGLQGSLGILETAALLGAVTIVIALVSIITLPESFNKDLDYLE
ncbi:MFS transporter [Rufibacter glacialis]|uniref:MFS transporter n=1 Tax=Rufibacter glacialis TaxID=1259555 RepID=A0A5M8QU23_9BACT|nr:MFS transporter [Rufibacter glacialis]KAA6438136.1 MFS transporter [Rufibacter glacialis]GGK88930.1 MFS transporter [Rufibacter glacialis]